MKSLTRQDTRRLIRTCLYILLAGIVVGYAIFATHDFILGPSLTIQSPQNGSTFTEPRITLKGQVKRIKDIQLNGRSITIDESGNWTETTLLLPGYNVFTFAISDKFGRHREYRLEVVYKVN